MKKYFIIALLLFEVSLNAQFTVAKSDNTPLTNGHILSFNSIVYAQAALALKITNTNANTINLKLKCTALTNTDGSLMEVCFGPDCYSGTIVNQVFPTSTVVSVGSGQVNSTAHFTNGDAVGNGNFPMDYTFKIYQVNGLGSEIGTPFTFTYRYNPNLSNAEVSQQFKGVLIKSTLVTSTLELEVQNQGTIKIYDLNGKQVYSGSLNQGNQLVDVSNLSSNLYIVNFTNNEGISFSQKILKK